MVTSHSACTEPFGRLQGPARTCGRNGGRRCAVDAVRRRQRRGQGASRPRCARRPEARLRHGGGHRRRQARGGRHVRELPRRERRQREQGRAARGRPAAVVPVRQAEGLSGGKVRRPRDGERREVPQRRRAGQGRRVLRESRTRCACRRGRREQGSGAARSGRAGKAAAAACAGCHGETGVSSMPGMPSLAGLDPAYFVAAMNAYKSGQRKDDMMKSIASVGQRRGREEHGVALRRCRSPRPRRRRRPATRRRERRRALPAPAVTASWA